MKTLVLVLSLVSLALVPACNGTTGAVDAATADMTVGPDLRMNPDLAVKLLGCNGYLQCLQKAMTQADQDDCDARASQMATDLLDAIDMCITTTCMAVGDGGTPFCANASDNSMRCVNCIQGSIM